jgi:hypothetical protein
MDNATIESGKQNDEQSKAEALDKDAAKVKKHRPLRLLLFQLYCLTKAFWCPSEYSKSKVDPVCYSAIAVAKAVRRAPVHVCCHTPDS